jgi:hypothetical protein
MADLVSIVVSQYWQFNIYSALIPSLSSNSNSALSLHESTTPVQRINVISPPPDRKAIEYQALPTRNAITEIESFHEHCMAMFSTISCLGSVSS